MSAVPSDTTRFRAASRPLGRALLAGIAGVVLLTPAVSLAQQKAPNFIRDTEIEETLHAESDPVFIAAGLNPKTTKILLQQDKEMNAFTVSGQEMGITTGLITQTRTPNELVGVMAHETGHAAGGHNARSGEMGKAGIRPMLLTLGLGLLAAAAGAPEAGLALAASSPYFGQLNMLTYSRVQESAADQAAVTYLVKAKESPKGLVDFFDNFRYEEVFTEARRFPFFQSHPISSERIELLRRRAEETSTYKIEDTAADIERHKIMQAKLDGFIQAPQQTLQKYPDTDKSYPARYARAIAYYKVSDTEKALKAIEALLVEKPDNPYLWELKGQVLFEAGRAKEAEPAHRRATELKPDAPLLRVNLAQSIIAQDKPARADEVIAQLQKALAFEDDNSFAWGLMAQAYDAKGEPGPARLASAEEHFSIGDYDRARIFAYRARESLKKDTVQWRRATDIALASKPTKDDLKRLDSQKGAG